MHADGRDQQIAALQDRLSRLSDASLRINESLDLARCCRESLIAPGR